jgi:hypothetical protein
VRGLQGLGKVMSLLVMCASFLNGCDGVAELCVWFRMSLTMQTLVISSEEWLW